MEQTHSGHFKKGPLCSYEIIIDLPMIKLVGGEFNSYHFPSQLLENSVRH